MVTLTNCGAGKQTVRVGRFLQRHGFFRSKIWLKQMKLTKIFLGGVEPVKAPVS